MMLIMMLRARAFLGQGTYLCSRLLWWVGAPRPTRIPCTAEQEAWVGRRGPLAMRPAALSLRHLMQTVDNNLKTLGATAWLTSGCPSRFSNATQNACLQHAARSTWYEVQLIAAHDNVLCAGR